jgi:hypothetical protein
MVTSIHLPASHTISLPQELLSLRPGGGSPEQGLASGVAPAPAAASVESTDRPESVRPPQAGLAAAQATLTMNGAWKLAKRERRREGFMLS